MSLIELHADSKTAEQDNMRVLLCVEDIQRIQERPEGGCYITLRNSRDPIRVKETIGTLRTKLFTICRLL